ncbi:amino acid ABC transporter permease [Janibacter sp. Soil728]|uniref:amino acid ABC transporter permease n=1 Tax=Janibacter sp. Soil728 TaxID=1736393 RepID=UPI0009E7714B|nr:amino acid ABC transporter permease [Janibacter sp. Soil728]
MTTGSGAAIPPSTVEGGSAPLSDTGPIKAVPVRHPGRWVALVIIAIFFAMVISSFVTNERWDWPFAFQVMNYSPVLEGLLKGTILATIGSMIIGVGLGVVIGVMRLSDNPVLKFVGFLYTWFFRGIPRLVLVVLFGTGIGYLYPKFDIGPFPFSQQLAGWLGMSSDLTLFTFNVNQISSTLIWGIIAMGLSEAAYMAEIARAGIMSVDNGQREAASALGMKPSLSMRRVILPQAMRVIIPPTGNETIAMLKDTSLLMALPLSTELFFQAQAIGNRTLKIMPTLMAACMWYLVITSVLMVGQYFLERHFGRGYGNTSVQTKTDTTKTRLMGLTIGGGK